MEQRGKRKIRIGIVASDKMQKTRAVMVETKSRHSKYSKIVRKMKKFLVDDSKEAAHKGDRVRIIETRPLSKKKRWRILEIIERAR